MSADDIAKAFTAHFYQVFDTDPNQLASLYQPQSMLTFEGSQHQGPEAIIAKLRMIGRVQHKVTFTDVQPSTDANGILIVVTGQLTIDGGNPLHFSEFFQLVSTGPGQYYVHNNVLRLIYG